MTIVSDYIDRAVDRKIDGAKASMPAFSPFRLKGVTKDEAKLGAINTTLFHHIDEIMVTRDVRVAGISHSQSMFLPDARELMDLCGVGLTQTELWGVIARKVKPVFDADLDKWIGEGEEEKVLN